MPVAIKEYDSACIAGIKFNNVHIFTVTLFPLRDACRMRVLVVEDERVLANAIAHGLRREGMATDVVRDGQAALRSVEIYRYDVVVLDRDIPLVHGDEVCRYLVDKKAEVRVLMLTAAGEIDDRVSGLNLGADDYLAKPFDFTELVARIRALARRAQTARPPILIKYDVVIDCASRQAERNGRPLDLTKKELAVLEVLLESAGKVVSAEELLERAWDEHANPFTNTIRVTIMNLRKKLGEPSIIETVTGEGYRL